MQSILLCQFKYLTTQCLCTNADLLILDKLLHRERKKDLYIKTFNKMYLDHIKKLSDKICIV